MKDGNPMIMNKKRKVHLNSSRLIPFSFLAAIVVGGLLLMLPISKAGEGSADFTTAFFTSTTSVCVTGLVVVDTFAYWTLFGKIVILILIQIGGLGVIAISSILILMLHKKFSLSQSLLVQDAFNLSTPSGVLHFLLVVFKGTFIVEMLGAGLYMFSFIPQYGAKGIWYSIFNSISAFCNAGIDILGPDSLISYQNDPYVLFVTMFLIVMGGLGYVVWLDVFRTVRHGIRRKYSFLTTIKRMGEHSKLVLTLTFSLIILGAVVVFCLEYNNPGTLGEMSFGDKVTNSLFQSVTFRTAGFASVPQDALRESTSFFGCILMFIGGSPVGTAGGVKTVTVFVMLLNAVSFIRRRKENVVFGRKVTMDMMHKATAIVMVGVLVTSFLLVILMIVSKAGLTDAMYETFSATATVGLSRSLTPNLNVAGRWVIILAMYLGRIGPISMALLFNYKTDDKNAISYAKGKFFIG